MQTWELFIIIRHPILAGPPQHKPVPDPLAVLAVQSCIKLSAKQHLRKISKFLIKREKSSFVCIYGIDPAKVAEWLEQ